MDYYYIKQGSTGIIRPIFKEEYPSLALLNFLSINDEPILKVGSDYIFRLNEGTEPIKNLKVKEKLRPTDDILNIEELFFIELGVINSKGLLDVTDKGILSDLDNLKIKIGYTNYPLKTKISINKQETDLEDISFYFIDTETHCSLTLAYLKSKVEQHPELSLHHEIQYSKNKIQVRAMEIENFDKLKEDLLDGNLITIEIAIKKSSYIFVYHEKDYIPITFYSKVELMKYLDSYLSDIDEEIENGLNLFRNEGV